ncbi:MAG: class I SAM-dependent methyltransferase [Candidatus Pacebacteria bacterium]|nr:class I SAM-dependent methyltransferase [Candidatus Paceibacterota bacterium]
MNPSKKLWDDVWINTNICYPHDIVLSEIKKLRDVRKILEIGAGTGRDLEELSKHGYGVTYSDFSSVAIEKFHKRNRQIETKECDARNLPFQDNSFDLVYSLGLLEHFDSGDRKKIISEMFRVSNNYVLIDVPQRYSFTFLIKKFLMLLSKWKYGEEIEFSYWQLSKEVKKTVPTIKIVSSYGREIVPLPRNFKNKFYQRLFSPIKKRHLKFLKLFYWGLAGSFGIIFKKSK